MAEFSRQIYPIWAGIEAKDRAADELLTWAQVNEAPVLFEVITTHRQDNAIRAAGIKVNRTIPAPPDIRRKAATAEKYGRWSERD